MCHLCFEIRGDQSLREFCERNHQPCGSLVIRVYGNSVRKNPSATWELGHQSLWEFCEGNPSAMQELGHQSLSEFCERNRQPHGSLVTRVYGNSVRKKTSATRELGHRSLWEFCERNPSATREFGHQSLWEFCKRNPSATQELGHQSLWEFCERNPSATREFGHQSYGNSVRETVSPMGAWSPESMGIL